MILRIRLLALAAISSSVTSDVLGGREYRAMVKVIVGSLLGCCEHVAIAELLLQCVLEPLKLSSCAAADSLGVRQV